jgi:hypothetical protein
MFGQIESLQSEKRELVEALEGEINLYGGPDTYRKLLAKHKG